MRFARLVRQDAGVHGGVQGLDPPVEGSRKPVSSPTSVTGRSDATRVAAVEPVDTRTTPASTSARPSSVRPSETLSSALRMGRVSLTGW